MQIETKFERIIYENNGFVIFATKDFTAKGYIVHQAEELLKIPVILEGEFKTSKYGEEFAFTGYKINVSDMEFFLKKIVKGLTNRTIKRIVDKYTEEEFEEILKNNPEELLSVNGIGEKKLQKIIQNYPQFKNMKELIKYLSPFGITEYMINTIYEHFKEDSLQIIKETPYRLIEIQGIGFKKADSIALKTGTAIDDPARLKEAIKYSINQIIENKGHTLVLKEEVFKATKENTETEEFVLSEEIFEKHITELTAEKELLQIDEYLTHPKYHFMETYIYNEVKKAKNGTSLFEKDEVLTYIHEFEKNHFQLDEHQKEAVLNFCTTTSNIFVLAGYAGSGKTTVSKLILDIFSKKITKESIVGCSLSGNAANRIKNVTGYQAYTIHSLLGFRGKEWIYNKDCKLPHQIIVLDEASMCNIEIFYRLISAIDFRKSKLFIIGDNAQLPPIGAGEVFNDLLQIDEIDIPKVILSKVFRQKEEQVINVYAQDIRAGRVPENYKDVNYEDFYFRTVEIPNYYVLRNKLTKTEFSAYREKINHHIYENIKMLVKKNKETVQLMLDTSYKEYINYLQVITPTKKGELGTEALNKLIKSIINPVIPDILKENEHYVKVGEQYYSISDKVIHLRNRNKPVVFEEDRQKGIQSEDNILRVFNGQVGVITDILTEDDEVLIEVYYPNEKYYTYYKKEDISNKEIDLAYAITVHKSQGSEYKKVIIPITMSHFRMLDNKLLYTAVTRAKQKLVILGESYAFEAGCKKKDGLERVTLLKYNNKKENKTKE